MFNLAVAVFTCKRDYVTGYEDAEELVVYDMDSKAVMFKVKKPRDIGVLEDILDDEGLDLWVFVTASIPEDVKSAIEDMGVKVQLVEKMSLREILEELFTV